MLTQRKLMRGHRRLLFYGRKTIFKMQWPEIEALVYSEHDRPRQILGQKVTEDGILITAFNPEAVDITVKKYKDDAQYPMEKWMRADILPYLFKAVRHFLMYILLIMGKIMW